jgi:hypothetical protein
MKPKIYAAGSTWIANKYANRSTHEYISAPEHLTGAAFGVRLVEEVCDAVPRKGVQTEEVAKPQRKKTRREASTKESNDVALDVALSAAAACLSLS